MQKERKEQILRPEIGSQEAQEVQKSPETAAEQPVESSNSAAKERALEVKKQVKERPARSRQKPLQQKSEVVKAVEEILSDGLLDVYLELPKEDQEKFKEKGEEVAQKIGEMVEHGRIRIKKVLDWIKSWLSMLPGMNAFFLEQEAKIKADRIISYYKSRKS
jgi:ElaB/YqjD/DUF883 family membrane-anchored ribosome-binding protein